ncbi:MAG: Eco57I restriction-modification methylase domain-containing protein, partial [Acidobacteriota bacterium]|nr:Eco57I restriction-modification methylase domain-containing protein [Acidobacteriota bacterium]
RKGVIDEAGEVIPLPAKIAAGVDEVSKRDGWNKTADAAFGLPTETWREYVARRKRCLELRGKLNNGEIHTVNELITWNLDIRQFAQDVILQTDDAALVRAFYRAIAGRVPEKSNEHFEHGLTVLDPTCGSGAFLFAALNILQPLYEACLDRMEAFVAEADQSGKSKSHEDFRRVLAQIKEHPNRDYFILKTIIIGNLYGVDIMEEAVEICKLRLFLKLAAQVERDESKPNYGLEPLPDIDFNIRAGNTLVGFTDRAAVDAAFAGDGQGKFDFDNQAEQFNEEAEAAERAFEQFRLQQTKLGGAVTPKDKAALRARLKKLSDKLDVFLAHEYGVETHKPLLFEAWRKSHQPFHWYSEFFGIIKSGGFDVVIGNPPYVELSTIRSSYRTLNFKTEPCGNLYALCLERCVNIQKAKSWLGLVVQQPFVSTQRMQSARDILSRQSALILSSTYDDRPSKLFDGIHHARIAIVLAQKSGTTDAPALFVTSYNKWYKEERAVLFPSLIYTKGGGFSSVGYFPKIGGSVEAGLIKKLLSCTNYFADWIHNQETEHKIYYKITGVGHWFTITARPPRFLREGKESSSTREHFICFTNQASRDRAFVLLNSSLFYWFYQVRTNCRDFNPSDYKTFPIVASLDAENLSRFSTRLQKALDESSGFISINHSKTGAIQVEQFRPRESKPIIDEIDRVLARHYGFTDEELDFIINYDIKYRMGRDGEE